MLPSGRRSWQLIIPYYYYLLRKARQGLELSLQHWYNHAPKPTSKSLTKEKRKRYDRELKKTCVLLKRSKYLVHTSANNRNPKSEFIKWKVTLLCTKIRTKKIEMLTILSLCLLSLSSPCGLLRHGHCLNYFQIKIWKFETQASVGGNQPI